MKGQIKVLIADDHQLFREGLSSLIEGFPDMMVVGEASNGREAVQLAEQLQPSVVIMDVTMPELNGIEASAQICALKVPPKIIALSMHSDRRFVLEALRAGVSAYLVKNCARKELETAIRIVLEGQRYLSPEITGIVIEDYIGLAPEGRVSERQQLSQREREVLQLIAEGVNTKEAAIKLRISPKTIEFHRKQIMVKLGLNNVAELTKYAVREGITPL